MSDAFNLTKSAVQFSLCLDFVDAHVGVSAESYRKNLVEYKETGGTLVKVSKNQLQSHILLTLQLENHFNQFYDAFRRSMILMGFNEHTFIFIRPLFFELKDLLHDFAEYNVSQKKILKVIKNINDELDHILNLMKGKPLQELMEEAAAGRPSDKQNTTSFRLENLSESVMKLINENVVQSQDIGAFNTGDREL